MVEHGVDIKCPVCGGVSEPRRPLETRPGKVQEYICNECGMITAPRNMEFW